MVYPIRYDTRATTERLAREQSGGGAPQLPTIGVIRQPPPGGTTAPTFPSDDQVPTSGTRPKTGPLGLPLPEDIMRRRREEEERTEIRTAILVGCRPTERHACPASLRTTELCPEGRAVLMTTSRRCSIWLTLPPTAISER